MGVNCIETGMDLQGGDGIFHDKAKKIRRDEMKYNI